jgi:hypothetical protein
LIYLAPAVIKKNIGSACDFLSFEDLPEEIDSQFSSEWKTIRAKLVLLDSTTQRGRCGKPEFDGSVNYQGRVTFDEMKAKCRENPEGMLVGFHGDLAKLAATSLEDLEERLYCR